MPRITQTLNLAFLYHLLGTALGITAYILSFNAFTTNAFNGIVTLLIAAANTLFLPAFIAQRFHYPTNESFSSQFTSMPVPTIPSVESIAWALIVGFIGSELVSAIAKHLSKKLE